jgi:hypothetical protein
VDDVGEVRFRGDLDLVMTETFPAGTVESLQSNNGDGPDTNASYLGETREGTEGGFPVVNDRTFDHREYVKEPR